MYGLISPLAAGICQTIRGGGGFMSPTEQNRVEWLLKTAILLEWRKALFEQDCLGCIGIFPRNAYYHADVYRRNRVEN